MDSAHFFIFLAALPRREAEAGEPLERLDHPFS
jgi:hypothetical protein